MARLPIAVSPLIACLGSRTRSVASLIRHPDLSPTGKESRSQSGHRQGNLLADQISPWLCILLVSKHIVGTGPLYHFTEKEIHYQFVAPHFANMAQLLIAVLPLIA